MTDILIIGSFAFGLVPALLLLGFYGIRSKWEASTEGRIFFVLVAVFAASYVLGMVGISFPAWFRSPAGDWVRIVTRLAIGGVLWALLWLVLRAQRRPRHTDPARDVSPPEGIRPPKD